MLPQTCSFDQSQNEISSAFLSAFKELQIAKLLYRSNIRKGFGIPVFEVFQRLVMLVFYGKNLFRMLESKHNDRTISKNTFYRFLGNPSFNWKRFLLLLAVRVTTAIRKLTGKSRVTVLVLDDSVMRRNRSKAVELLAKVYDHVFHEFVRGFNLLALGWSDGFSFFPVAFTLLSSAKVKNRYQEASSGVDHRTSGWKARLDSMRQKPEAALRMIQSALDAGIGADYILMDSWFTTEPFVQSLRKIGLHVIGMVKDVKQRYAYRGHFYTLPELAKIAMDKNASHLYRSLLVRTKKHNLPVRIVFVRNRNKRSELLYLLTTDTALSEDETIRIYGMRWSIETFFKASKSLFKLSEEFQTRNYDAAVAHTAIVFTRYTILEWLRRQENDDKTYGGLFFAMCEDVQDMELSEALTSLMGLFMEAVRGWRTENTKIIQSKVNNWIASQSRYIQGLFSNLCWES